MLHKGYRNKTISFLAILGAICIIASGYIAYYDPLMVTGFITAQNRIVPTIDARIQKTNKLLNYRADYDGLLIGSSRVEQLRQEDFQPLKVFNYAVPSIYPDEYVDYIDLFFKTNKNKSPIVFIGFDFYGSNGNYHDHAKAPKYYIEMCSSFFYVSSVLLSKDTFIFARKMARRSNGGFSYDRQTLDKIHPVVSKQESEALLQKQLEIYKSTFYGDYVYNKSYRKTLQDIKRRLTGLDYVVFTTPESLDLLMLLADKGLMNDYEQWLTDMVTTFGSVYNLMKPGHFTANLDNFMDAHHLLPEKSTPIVNLITGKVSNIDGHPGDCLITGKNIKQKLFKIRFDVENLKKGR